MFILPSLGLLLYWRHNRNHVFRVHRFQPGGRQHYNKIKTNFKTLSVMSTKWLQSDPQNCGSQTAFGNGNTCAFWVCFSTWVLMRERTTMLLTPNWLYVIVVAKVVHGQKLFCFQTMNCEILQKLNCADAPLWRKKLNGGAQRAC
jgi:hypothetical protein